MEFKAYLSQKYQGYDSFIKNIIYPIFGEDRYETAYNIEMLEQNQELTGLAERTGIRSVIYCGIIELEDNPVYLFDITVKDKVMMERNRVAVQTLVKRVMDTYSGAFMLIHYEQSDKWDWRFTFCQLKDKGEYTDSKRYTFLLGPNQACTTAAQNFGKLAAKEGEIEISDIVKAFDVEALSNEFFGKYKAYYESFVEYITGKRYEGKEEMVVHDSHPLFKETFNEDDKAVRDYVKLLMGRITFLHFVQKKGWLGVPENGVWGTGDEQFMLNSFEKASPELKVDFVMKVLNPMFFGALDTDRADAGDVFESKVFGRIRVPYLNGGMFEKSSIDEKDVAWPAEYFGRLLKFFSEYNFTIDENDPNEAQVGVDPEMLGKIFENLLEDNKDKGAFYTPKEIVKYMCQESLIAYLVTKTGYDERLIRDFVHSPEEGKAAFSEDQQYAILDAILKVKICDPAIGSGAFPIGLLNELVWCKEAIYGDKKGRAEIKREIIRDNIYGVDVEKGAVDIARLRFWLSLVVDEEEPSPLPNLDYKIMQGNSLLEWYNGVDLTELVSKNGQDLMFNNEYADILKQKLSKLLKDYFGVSNHAQKAAVKREISSIIRELLSNAGVVIPEDLDVAENNRFFLWHSWYKDVFDVGGFDIVIGNPPYGATLTEEEKNLYRIRFSDVHMRTPETFCYFISLALRLSQKNNAVISFIVPNNLFFQHENTKTRELLIYNNSLLRAVNLGDSTFENADVPTCIFIVRTGKCEQYNIEYSDYRSYDIKSLDWNKNVDEISVKELKSIPDIVLGMNSAEISILNKIKAHGVLIDEIAEEVACGISTGGNNAFCVSLDEYQNGNYEKDLIHPVLAGYEIDRYAINSEGNRIIYTQRNTDIKKFPIINSRLSLFKERLAKRSECRSGIIPWWVMNRPRYPELFTGPKIIMRQTSDSIRCVYDGDGYYVIDSILVLKIKNPELFDYNYIVGVLNSKLSSFIYRGLTQETGRTFAQVKPANVRKLSIPNVGKDIQMQVSNLVRLIVEKKKMDASRHTLEEEMMIDSIVYSLFGLTKEEIKLIEG